MTAIGQEKVASHIGAISEGQASFFRAIAAAASHWNDEILPPEVEERTVPALRKPWTPRYACWHVLSSHSWMAELVIEHARQARRGATPPMREQHAASWWASQSHAFKVLRAALVDPVDARATTIRHWAEAAELLAVLEDLDLEAPWEPGQFNLTYARSLGQDLLPNVGGLLQVMTLHLKDHAAQIQSKVGELD